MDKKDFRVSVIITSYNHKGFLIEALESVLNQTLPTWEILVADDASTDGSRELIHQYEKKYPGHVKGIYQKKNVGIPKNRNAALRTVTGNYVGILDGDDLFLPQKLESQYQSLCRSPGAKAVYSNFGVVDMTRNPVAVKWGKQQPEGYIFPQVARVMTGILRTMVADYQLVKQAGFMDERFPKYDGLWLTIKLSATCKFAYVNDVLLEKREHETSDSKSLTKDEHLHDLKGIYHEMKPLLSKHVEATERAQIDAVWQQWFARF